MHAATLWIHRRRVALGISALAILAYLVPVVGQALELSRARPLEPWRALSCHVAHFDATHLFWSGAVFAGLALWLEPRGRGRMLACIVVAALVIAAGVWLWLPSITTYRGLSGIDSALFAMALVELMRDEPRRARRGWLAVLGAGFAAKIVYEMVTGTAVFADSAAFTPVPLAHALGAAVGSMFAACAPRHRRTSRRPTAADQDRARAVEPGGFSLAAGRCRTPLATGESPTKVS